MAEECPTLQVSSKEDDAQMECEMSELKPTKVEDGQLDKESSTLPVSGATSVAATTPISESECLKSSEDVCAKGTLTLPVSGATSVTASTPVSDSGFGTSPGKSEPLAVPISEAAATTSTSDSGCGDAQVEGAAADPSSPPEAAETSPCPGCTAGNLEMLSPEKVSELLSPEKEKVGIFKGVRTAIKSTVKSVWKKLSPKKVDKASLAASSQETQSTEASVPETEKKPIKVVTYVSATRGSLVLNSFASEEMTTDTDLPTSASEVFLPDQESIATCDTSTHASRLPSLGETGSEPSEESPKHDAEENTGDRVDETMDEGNNAES